MSIHNNCSFHDFEHRAMDPSPIRYPSSWVRVIYQFFTSRSCDICAQAKVQQAAQEAGLGSQNAPVGPRSCTNSPEKGCKTPKSNDSSIGPSQVDVALSSSDGSPSDEAGLGSQNAPVGPRSCTNSPEKDCKTPKSNDSSIGLSQVDVALSSSDGSPSDVDTVLNLWLAGSSKPVVVESVSDEVRVCNILDQCCKQVGAPRLKQLLINYCGKDFYNSIAPTTITSLLSSPGFDSVIQFCAKEQIDPRKRLEAIKAEGHTEKYVQDYARYESNWTNALPIAIGYEIPIDESRYKRRFGGVD